MKTAGSLLLLLYPWLMLLSCKTAKPSIDRPENSLNKVWDHLEVLSQLHSGLSIYDADRNTWIFNYRDDNYFTPASCTKLLTMYTVLRYMDEQIPAAYYKIKNDTIIIWGGGDPGTLYPDIHGPSSFIQFLKSTDKQIIFSEAAFKTEHYGKGWAWDDYPYSFQSDRTAFPIYGNRLWIERRQDTIHTTPQYLRQLLNIKKDTFESKGRNEWGTNFYYHYNSAFADTTVGIPISFFENDENLIWSEALGKDILWKEVAFSANTFEIQGSSRDSLLKIMMQKSDNFIAEQLLLACAMKETDHMNETDMIKKMVDGPLHDLPDSIEWVDGSGLSRYNLVTPRAMVWVMQQIMKQKGKEYMKSILPAGGQSGTLINDYYGKNGHPYLFAKSGSMRHVYCMTGMLETNSGHTFLFSWLNNDFWGHNARLKAAMEHLFIYLRDNY
ncbi:MAG: D-alanyl-D-alanine carboxypeptidase [Saprospiraceae bacterium]